MLLDVARKARLISSRAYESEYPQIMELRAFSCAVPQNGSYLFVGPSATFFRLDALFLKLSGNGPKRMTAPVKGNDEADRFLFLLIGHEGLAVRGEIPTERNFPDSLSSGLSCLTP